MSPVLILSRLCLTRRFHFLGISETSSCSTARTFWTVSSSITRRRPASAAFSHGTITVMSLCRILMVRYSRSSPNILRRSFLRTLPAPWWGYTTLSPHSKSMFSGAAISRSSTRVASTVSGMVILLASSPTRSGPRGGGVGVEVISSRLQVAVDEIDLLQAAKALADVLRPDLADALDGLELGVRGREHLVEAAELVNDLLDDELRQPRDAAQDPVAAGRHGIVKRVDLAVVAEQLGEAPEVQEVLVGQPADLVQRAGECLVAVLGEVVVHERGLVGGGADHRLLELHLDEPALGAELDDVALDLDGHARHELRALEHREDVVQRGAALELERGQAGRDLVEARAVLVERRQRLVGLGQDDRDVLEDVLRAVDVERDDLAPLRDGDDERVRLLGDALGRAVARAGLEGQDRRVRHELDVGHR